MNANTLTYGDLLYIRDLLIADQSAKKEILGRVETMLGEHGEPNAESLAALEEAKSCRLGGRPSFFLSLVSRIV